MKREYNKEVAKLLKAKKQINRAVERELEIKKLYPNTAGKNLEDYTAGLLDALLNIDLVIDYITKKENLD